MTVALGQSSAKFHCNGQGLFLDWVIGDDKIVGIDESIFNKWKGFTFDEEYNDDGSLTITLSVPAVLENNNTQLSCFADGQPDSILSEPVNLTIAGRTVTNAEVLFRFMHLSFMHVVNANLACCIASNVITREAKH